MSHDPPVSQLLERHTPEDARLNTTQIDDVVTNVPLRCTSLWSPNLWMTVHQSGGRGRGLATFCKRVCFVHGWMFVLLLPLHVDALSSLQQLQKTNPPESETHPVNKLDSGHFGWMLIVLFWGATASLTISRAMALPSGLFLCHSPSQTLRDKLLFTSDTRPGCVFSADDPCRGSYDALVLLCNVLHMAPGRGSKLWVEWCFCSTQIIPKERAKERERERKRKAASNKVVKTSAEAWRQHTPPGSCCLPGVHLQII